MATLPVAVVVTRLLVLSQNTRAPTAITSGASLVMSNTPLTATSAETPVSASTATIPSITEAEFVAALHHFAPLWDELFPAEQVRIVRLLVDRVEIGQDGAEVRLRMDGLAGLVREMQSGPDTARRAA
jgi:hypothetical protein